MLLSFMVKPALHLIFDVKKRVDVIKRKKWREKKRREKWRYGRRPITIHKHYYKNVVAPRPHKPHPPPHISHHPPPYIVHDPPPHLSPHPPPSWPAWLGSDKIDFKPKPQLQSAKPKLSYRHEQRKHFKPPNLRHNPLLPEVADEIEDWPYGPKLQFKPSRTTLPMHFGSTSLKSPQPSVSAEYEDAPFL
ncbi:unnamed protein product [Ceratitis capitata]|uniref:(Mediterranean fruit fly) hypothetical protein n=2 Tax=Ceratitis capitata TaxID=7213 RepID=A0A811UXB3_CERCA|nr:unnamed protein product [Ceratitis capitata]